MHFRNFRPPGATMSLMSTPDRQSLEARSVLVRIAGDPHNPPVASRGTLHLEPDPSVPGKSRATLTVDFPDMFTAPAHQRVIELDEAALGRLLAGERDGTLEWTIEENLEAETRDKTVVAPRATQPE